MPIGTIRNETLARELLETLDMLSGLHAGYRPAHAKGLMCSGMFSPSAARLTRASHAIKSSTPVTVRFSNASKCEEVRRSAEANPHEFHARSILRSHIVQVHERQRGQSARAISHPA